MSEFAEDYVEQCFQMWYLLPTASLDKLWDSLPPDANGNKPAKTTLRSMRDSYGWVERADGMNALAVQKAEHLLVDRKADMLKRQAEDAFQIATMAKDHLIENGFDTSSTAVNALKWATEEERTVRGVSEMLIKISRMTNEELESRRVKLLRRQNEAVDAEVLEDTNADQGG